MIPADAAVVSHFDPRTRISIVVPTSWREVRTDEQLELVGPAARLLARLAAGDPKQVVDAIATGAVEDRVIDGVPARARRSAGQLVVAAQVPDAVVVVAGVSDASMVELDRAIASIRFLGADRVVATSAPRRGLASLYVPGLALSLVAPRGWSVGGDPDWPLIVCDERVAGYQPRLRVNLGTVEPATTNALIEVLARTYDVELPAKLAAYRFVEKYGVTLDAHPLIAVRYAFEVDRLAVSQLDAYWLVGGRLLVIEAIWAGDDPRLLATFEEMIGSLRHVAGAS